MAAQQRAYLIEIFQYFRVDILLICLFIHFFYDLCIFLLIADCENMLFWVNEK